MPDIDSTLVGFRIEKLFEYSETDGTTYFWMVPWRGDIGQR